MKDIRPALYTLLLSDATVNGLVGGSRIFPVRLPQGTKAQSLVYHRVTGEFDYEMDGPSGLVQNLIQLDSIATSNDLATQLANAAHDVLTGFRGQVSFGTNSPQDFVFINGIFQQADRDLFDTVTELFSVQRDFQVWFWES